MTTANRPVAPTYSPVTAETLPPGFTLEPLPLHEHIAATYFDLRVGIAALAFALPLLISILGRLLGGLPLQGSMSAYYHAGNGVMRDEFVGILVAIGAFLILYKGFSRQENWAMNLAGTCAWFVAIFPMQWQCEPNCSAVSVHGSAAVVLFLSIAYVCLFRATDTLSLLPNQNQVPHYKRAYRSLGGLMIASPLAAIVADRVILQSGKESHTVFFIEMFGVWVFAAYWFTKSLELRASSVERLALEGKLARAKAPRRALPDDAKIVRL